MAKLKPILGLTLLSSFFAFIFKAYYQRIGAFGCFDDCFNFVAAYFMLKGKTLYSEIFFSHQPLMAILSYLIQLFGKPQTIYQLIAFHRIFILLFSLVMDIFLILRFRWVGLGFVIFYETTKFYLFGDRFLGEAMITYLLVYLMGLLWEIWMKKKISAFELFWAAFFAWVMMFTREAFIPIAGFLFFLIIKGTKPIRLKMASILLFAILTFSTLLSLPLPDYFFNVVRANFSNLGSEISNTDLLGIGTLKIFAYPFYIFLAGEWNYFHQILIGLSTTFLILVSFGWLKLKMRKESLLIFLILGLSNIRFVEPGSVFYGAFHMAPWYGLFIAIIFLLLKRLVQKKSPGVWLGLTALGSVFVYIILSPQWFIKEKIIKDVEFTTGYGHYFVTGEVVKTLATAGDTLFLDGWDDLIYWQANLPSPYKYSWYTSDMPFYPVYTQAREEMFKNNPPTFYYGNCSQKLPYYLLPGYRQADYLPLHFSGKPTCLYIKKTKLAIIENDKWEKVKKFGFYLP